MTTFSSEFSRRESISKSTKVTVGHYRWRRSSNETVNCQSKTSFAFDRRFALGEHSIFFREIKRRTRFSYVARLDAWNLSRSSRFGWRHCFLLSFDDCCSISSLNRVQFVFVSLSFLLRQHFVLFFSIERRRRIDSREKKSAESKDDLRY